MILAILAGIGGLALGAFCAAVAVFYWFAKGFEW